MKASDSYNVDWDEVAQAEQRGLPESALKIVNRIYQQAKKEKNQGQQIKALIHQMRFSADKEEEELALNIHRVEEELKMAVFPAKAILHSMLGEMYWNYYQQNRWQFQHRSTTTLVNQKEITTWSLPQITAAARHHYEKSCGILPEGRSFKIHNEASIKSLSNFALEAILIPGNKKGKLLQPTLYDLLAQRALFFFQQEEASLTKPVYAFRFNNPAFLSDTKTFSTLSLVAEDTSSNQYLALLLYQSLTVLHSKDVAPDALIDTELKRLSFVHQHTTLPEKDSLYLQSLQKLEKQFSKFPAMSMVLYHKALHYQQSGSRFNPQTSSAFQWELKKAAALCQEAKEKFPQSDGALLCEEIKTQLLLKSVSAFTEEVNIPEKPFRALIQYKNIAQLYWRAVPVQREEVLDLRKKLNQASEQEQQFLAYFLAKPIAKSGSVHLPDDQDYQQHSAELKIEALPVGEYLLLFSHKPDFSLAQNGIGYAFTTISNLSFVHRNQSNGGTDLYVLHRETGEPLANVQTQLLWQQYNHQSGETEIKTGATWKSNAEGKVEIPYQNSENTNRQNLFFRFVHQKDQLYSNNIENGYNYVYQYKATENPAAVQTFFFLDRSIYRPGQPIYFKGLAVKKDDLKSEILPKKTITVYLRNVNQEEVAKQTFTTNEYGTFNGTFAAPAGGLTGQMQLQCSDGSGNAFFSVEEYKRPKFEVSFEPVKGAFRVGDLVKVQGKAQAYSGALVDGANVAYRVVRTARFPFWWWCRTGYFPEAPEMEIASGLAQTDASGVFTLPFTALPDLSADKKGDPVFTYKLTADVTDLNGETHSNETTVEVGYKALELSVTAQEWDLAKPLPRNLIISTTNLAGQFEPAKGSLTVSRLASPNRTFRKRLWPKPDKFLYSQQEFYHLFPTDIFDEEDNELKWQKETPLFQTAFDSEKSTSLALTKGKEWVPGRYQVDVTSTDKYGQPVQAVAFFNVFDSESKTLPVPAIEYVKQETANREPGETAVFTLGSSVSIQVLFEVERDNKIISSKWIKLNKEKQKLELPITETDRGNIAVHTTFIRDSRLYTSTQHIIVPYTNKQLNITFETFRDKLQPGQKEEWRIKIKGPMAEVATAEMAATLYDASLDAFRSHSWSASFWASHFPALSWRSTSGFRTVSTRFYDENWNKYEPGKYTYPEFPGLNWFDYSSSGRRRFKGGPGAMREELSMTMAAPAHSAMWGGNEEEGANKVATPKFDASNVVSDQAKETNTHDQAAPLKIRSNFNETAFFYPDLKTNEKGELVISFTMPDALTRWKMLGFAHSKDLKSALIGKELVTQKDLMVVPNAPRFFREGDRLVFSSKVTSLVDKPLSGKATLQLKDALTGLDITEKLLSSNQNKSFDLKPKQSAMVEWELSIPANVQAITYQVTATAGAFSDGEEMTLPVVSNRMLVTETLPLPVRGKGTKNFTFDKLLHSQSRTLKNHQLTLEFTANPAWYAVQALPYLMEYPYECVEQTFSRYYANSLASFIANSDPKIRQVFDIWKNIQPEALRSNLDKNEALKSTLLEETPWMLEAANEEQRKRQLGLLLDLNRMVNEQTKALKKVAEAQTSNGGFAWFPGMPEDRYMTQHIVAGFGHLKALHVPDNASASMLIAAVTYLDKQLLHDYELLKAAALRKELKPEEHVPDYLKVHFLYARSFYKEVKPSEPALEAANYYLAQCKKYWLKYPLFQQAQLALILHRQNEKEAVKTIIASLRERALHSEEMGMYYKQTPGYYWYEAPVETQALLIEAFEEAANDFETAGELKVWLLKQKQTSDWKTTRATAEACYALLHNGTTLLANSTLPDIQVGKQKLDPAKGPGKGVEAGTGYFKTSWNAAEVQADMGTISITKTDNGVAWGAAYWQYFEQLDKITPSASPLSVKKQLYLQEISDRGPVISPVTAQTNLKVGDLIKVRIELRSDRDMEYLHLKDMRASGLEPVTTLSTSKYQDGLWYYENTRDLATNFFIHWLPKGTYVFEYSLRVSQKGDFSNGITSIQSMYAPEFSSHSEGIRLNVK